MTKIAPNLNFFGNFLFVYLNERIKNPEKIKDLKFPHQSRHYHQISGQLAFSLAQCL